MNNKAQVFEIEESDGTPDAQISNGKSCRQKSICKDVELWFYNQLIQFCNTIHGSEEKKL